MEGNKLTPFTTVKSQTGADVKQLGPLVSQFYPTTSTNGQTVITLNFAVDQTLKANFWLFIDGNKLTEGSGNNYTFTNIQNGASSEITLSESLIAGLSIEAYLIGVRESQLVNAATVTATLNNDVGQPHKMAQAGFQPFIAKSFITAPNTQIINRSQVLDDSGSLKSISGVERLLCKSLSYLITEFGPNGETVYELQNRDSRVRFVGSWFSGSDTGGARIRSTTTSDYVEIVFYGTGLNLLWSFNASSRDVRVTIDGGVEGANIYTAGSGVLDGRNYSPNVLVNIASGLSLGWHNIKIRNASIAVGLLEVYGLEILNERSNLAVLGGSAYNGSKQEILSALSSSSFSAGVTGTRGARVIKYIKDGLISQAVTEVNPSAAYLSSADHTNEDVYRKINFREFGVNRSDDFSTLTGSTSSRAFTLDDGTTTLICPSAVMQSASPDAIYCNTTATGITITFVGCGLDVYLAGPASTPTDSYSLIVNGVNQGAMPTTNNTNRQLKIASGLPYGTHIIQFLRNVNSVGTFTIADFFIYQPKKPTLPNGAIEVCDYNLLANYVATSASSATIPYMGTGMVRKIMTQRETTFSGTWSAITVDLPFFVTGGGQNTSSTGSGAYNQISFWGTGFELSYSTSSGSVNASNLTVDGASNLSGFTTSIVQSTSGAVFTASTGAVSGTNSGNNRIKILVNGLTLGWHTIRMTHNSAASQYADTIDFITPIHFNNTKIGSLSLKDSRVFSPIIDKPEKIDLSKVKASLVYDKTNNKILSSSNILAVLSISTGAFTVFFEKSFKSKETIAFSGGILDSGTVSLSSVSSQFWSKSFITLQVRNGANTPTDYDYNSILFFGELEDEFDNTL